MESILIQSIIGIHYGRVSMDFKERNVTKITCHAAGNGIFLQETLTKLGISIDAIDTFEAPENPVVISNMCAVFASSEIVSMLAKGINKNQIVHGIINTIAQFAGAIGAAKIALK